MEHDVCASSWDINKLVQPNMTCTTKILGNKYIRKVNTAFVTHLVVQVFAFN